MMASGLRRHLVFVRGFSCASRLSRIKHVADFVQFKCFFAFELSPKTLFELLAMFLENLYITRTFRKVALRRLHLLLAVFDEQFLSEYGVLSGVQFQAHSLQVFAPAADFNRRNRLPV